MKSSLQFFVFGLVVITGCLGSQTAFAQSAPSSTPSAAAQPLTMQDKMRLMKVRNQVLADNPDLKAEADQLKQQGQSLKGGNATPDQKMAFFQSLQQHSEKMKAAMLKVDPTLGPIIDQADADMKQKMQQRMGGGN